MTKTATKSRKRKYKHSCVPAMMRFAGKDKPIAQFPGHIASVVKVCPVCGAMSFKGLRPDPDYVPAERGPARDVLAWIEARLPKDSELFAEPTQEELEEFYEDHPPIVGGAGTNYFWVGGTANWDGTATGWSLTTGGAGGAGIPGAADTVTFDTNSGASTITATVAYSVTSVTINRVNITLTHAAGATSTVSGAMTLTIGTLNTGGQTCSWGSFSSSNGNTRTITQGASAITVTGGGAAWTVTNVGGLTITANTATQTLTGASATWSSGTISWNGSSVVMSGSGNATIAGSSPTAANFTRTGTAAKTDLCILSAATLTCTGTFTCNGNSLVNRVLLQTTQIGLQRTITAAVTSLSNTDFMDIAGAGAAAWTGTSLGNCGGNSTITFTGAVTRFRVGASGNWSDTTHWSTTSGGSSGASVPLPQDTVNVNAGASGTVSMDMPRTGAVDFTGFAGTFNQAVSFTGFGDFKIAAGMTFTAGTMTLAGRGAQILTSNGKSFNNLTINGFGGTYTLQDNLTVSASYVTGAGGLDANGHDVTLGSWTSTSAVARATTMGSGTWTITGTGTIINWVNQSTHTLNAGTSTLVISDTSATGKTLSLAPPLGTPVFNNLSITGGGTGSVTLAGASSWNTITTTGPKTVIFPASSTTTVRAAGGFFATGSSGNLITITSSTAGTQATISCASGIVACNWLSLKDIAATGGASFYAGADSTNVSNNTGWTFTTVQAFSLTASSASTASALVTAATLVSTNAASSTSSSADITPITVPQIRGSSSSTSSSSNSITAASAVSGNAASNSTSTLSLTAPTSVPLAGGSSVSNASASISAATSVLMLGAASSSTISGALTVATRVALDGSSSVSATANSLSAAAMITGAAASTSTSSISFLVPRLVGLQASSSTSAATATVHLSVQLVPLDPAASAASDSVVLSVPVLLLLSPAASTTRSGILFKGPDKPGTVSPHSPGYVSSVPTYGSISTKSPGYDTPGSVGSIHSTTPGSVL